MTKLKNVCFFFKPFLTLFDIYFYINHIRYTTSIVDYSRSGTCTAVGTVRNALGMMDCNIHNAIETLQNGTDIQPLFSISRAKERLRWG